MLRFIMSAGWAALALVVSACSIEAAQPFDFESATPEARLEWMTPNAAATARGISDSLNGYGSLSKFEVSEPAINARRGIVTFEVQSSSQYYQFETSPKARKQLEASLCGSYLNSPFADVGVTNVFVLKQQNGNQAMRLRLAPPLCNRVTGAA